jgi:hypothetical protein
MKTGIALNYALILILLTQAPIGAANDLVAPPSKGVKFEQQAGQATPQNGETLKNEHFKVVTDQQVALQQAAIHPPAQFQPAPNISAMNTPEEADSIQQNFMNLLAPLTGMSSAGGNPTDFFNQVYGQEGFQATPQEVASWGESRYPPGYNYQGALGRYGFIGSTRAPSTFAGYNCDNRGQKDALTCMVCNTYFEANNQNADGQTLVGQVVMARLFTQAYTNSPKDKTVCGQVYKVVGKTAAFSWVTDGKDHVLHVKTDEQRRMLEEVVKNAKLALSRGPRMIEGRNIAYTNYWAPKAMIPAYRKPGWYAGQCQSTPPQRVDDQIFCSINGKITRNLDEVIASDPSLNARVDRQIASETNK